MKKSSVVAAIIACISFVLFGVSAVFVKWDREAFDATSSVIITSIIAFAVFNALFVIFALCLKKAKLAMLIPTLGLFFVNIVFTKGINEVLNAQGINPANSVLSMLSPSESTVLGLLLAIAFITSIVLVLLKNYKWASLIAIVYSVILVVTTYNYTAEILFEGNLLYLFVSLGALFTLVSLVIFFAAPLIPNNEIVKAEKPQNVEEEKTEDVKEENVEETENDSDEDEEKSEPQDPFKNQYASSETVFDVQEKAEDKE